MTLVYFTVRSEKMEGESVFNCKSNKEKRNAINDNGI